eukprot:9049836-Alexandrium_andersonii.AAC.1
MRTGRRRASCPCRGTCYRLSSGAFTEPGAPITAGRSPARRASPSAASMPRRCLPSWRTSAMRALSESGFGLSC